MSYTPPRQTHVQLIAQLQAKLIETEARLKATKIELAQVRSQRHTRRYPAYSNRSKRRVRGPIEALVELPIRLIEKIVWMLVRWLTNLVERLISYVIDRTVWWFQRLRHRWRKRG